MIYYSIFGSKVASNYPLIGPNNCISGRVDLEFVFEGIRNSPLAIPKDQIVYSSPDGPSNEDTWISLYHENDHYVIHFAQTANFFIWRDQITAQLLDPKYQEYIELYFLGSVFSLWQELQGMPALHSSCIEVGHNAIAFLAAREAGKSTIAATMVQSGCPLMTDDVLPIEMHNNIFCARPGYPQMKLWSEGAIHFLGHRHDLELVTPSDPLYSKYRIPIGTNGFGTFCSEARPLSVIYLPKRQDSNSSIMIEPMSPRDALIELIRYSFIAEMVEALGLRASRIKFLATLAMHVPMRRISYPAGFENLEKLRYAILDDLAGLKKINL